MTESSRHLRLKRLNILVKPFEELYKDLERRGLLIKIYAETFEERDLCASCKEKVRNYYKKLRDHFKIKEIMANSKYRLKEDAGVMQMEFGSAEFISNDNITDEIAEQFLKINPNRIVVFEEFPEDWEDLISEDTQEETVDVFGLKLTIEEVKELLSEAGITSNATTIKGISKKIENLTEEESEKLRSVIEA